MFTHSFDRIVTDKRYAVCFRKTRCGADNEIIPGKWFIFFQYAPKLWKQLPGPGFIDRVDGCIRAMELSAASDPKPTPCKKSPAAHKKTRKAAVSSFPHLR
jgi:hypothetical protein